MGAIHFSLDENLRKCLTRHLPLRVFVETGTFRADTTRAVAPHFAQVYTIEFSPELHAAAVETLRPYPNVTALEGNSPEVLGRLQPELQGQSVLYWLDAHWCGAQTAGKAAECPLLAEFEAIGQLNEQSVILVDDARYFLAPAPRHHRASDWPTLATTVDRLRALSPRHEVWVINDVIIFAPQTIAADVVEYGQAHGIDLYELAQAAFQAKVYTRP